jgi:hypothetical protein
MYHFLFFITEMFLDMYNIGHTEIYIYIVNHSTLHNFNRDCEGGRINPHYMKTFIRTARHMDTRHHHDSQASGHKAPS